MTTTKYDDNINVKNDKANTMMITITWLLYLKNNQLKNNHVYMSFLIAYKKLCEYNNFFYLITDTKKK